MRVFAAVTLLFGGSGARARAQGDPPPPRLPRTLEDPVTPLSPAAVADRTVATPVLDAAQDDHARIVYQSFQDGNWEIYTSLTAPFGGGRLTADGAADVEPKLSPNMSQAVFSSRRTGNYELFRVNVDGGGLLQLTQHPATDSAGAWSPDGRRIAFQSNRNGNYDVFVMNADGSGLTALTSNPDYDGEPTWSPDGTRIAYISKHSTGTIDYYLYAMNADGSGQHLLAPVPYSSRPAWSHSGSLILFDGLSGSGWQRLYRYNLATGQADELAYLSNQPNIDVLSGAWGINDTVYFTRVNYVQYNGQWYINTMDLLSVDGPTGVMSALPLGDRAAFPSWANPDHVAPMSLVLPGGEVQVRANVATALGGVGLDSGIAGFGGMDVQVRVNGAFWINLSACTAHTGGVVGCQYSPYEGSRFEYRVRSRDAFGNLEPWPVDPQQFGVLNVYGRMVTGSVTDLRGLPLAAVPVTGIPAYEPSLASNGAGAWVAHQTGSGLDYTLTAGLPGSVVSIPAGNLQQNGVDRLASIVLPPTDNVIANPGFTTPASGWLPLPATSLSWLSAVAVGADSPVMRLNTSAATRLLAGQAVAAGSVISGTATVLAYVTATGNQLAICPNNTDCVSEPVSGSQTIDLARRADGTLAVIVRDVGASTRSFLVRSPQGVWSAPQPFPYLGTGASHRLLADSASVWHYVWAEGDGMMHVAYLQNDGTWSGAQQAGAMPLGADSVFDGDDVLHIVGCPSSGVIEVTWSEANGMSQPTTVSTETCTGGHQGTTIDDAGRIDTVWVDQGVARFSRRLGAGAWGPAHAAAGLPLLVARAVGGPDGRALLVVQVNGDTRLVQTSADGTAWETLTGQLPLLPVLPGRTLLAFNAATRSAIVSEVVDPYTGYARQISSLDFAHASDTGAYQVVSIPGTAHRPVLSAQYRFVDGTAGDALTLSIQGATDPAPVSLPLSTFPTWQHSWLDVSAWAGQTVTVTIQLTQDGVGFTPVVDFNEVDLGSWLTPVVYDVAPVRIPAVGATLVITGDNFLATSTVLIGDRAAATTVIDAQHLSIVVPGDAPLGIQPVVVTNAGGWATVAPQPVQLGASIVRLPAVMRWSPPGWP